MLAVTKIIVSGWNVSTVPALDSDVWTILKSGRGLVNYTGQGSVDIMEDPGNVVELPDEMRFRFSYVPLPEFLVLIPIIAILVIEEWRRRNWP
jgi:hypothetical protein